jgi:hypothetical protein
MSRPATAKAPSPQRSAVTNGTRVLVGVNGNSAKARRYRDLVQTLSAELGDELSETERLAVRNAATLQFHSEELTAALVRGEAVDPEEITRAINGASRALAALQRGRAARRAKPATSPLRAYLAGKAAG